MFPLYIVGNQFSPVRAVPTALYILEFDSDLVLIKKYVKTGGVKVRGYMLLD